MKASIKVKFQYPAACLLGWTTTKKNSLRVLTYHSVSQDQNKDFVNHVPAGLFEEQMRYLAESGYKSFCAHDILEIRSSIPASTPGVIVTFDDGLCNNFTTALPILEKYGIKATFFIPAGYISDTRKLVDAKEMSTYKGMELMSWKDIDLLVKKGYEIGSHSHHHLLIAQLPRDDAAKQLMVSKQIIEEKIGRPVCSFAYPMGRKGAYALWTRQMLEENGYKIAFTQEEGRIKPDSDLLQLPRTNICGADDLGRFKMKLQGYYDCLGWLRKFH
jgi:peptidoglycan/xylan/chitin deacetylase (PgdA/CDA1 family)